MAVKQANDVPQFFRLNIEVGDLNQAVSFYSTLLGIEGRKQAGARCYISKSHIIRELVPAVEAAAKQALN